MATTLLSAPARTLPDPIRAAIFDMDGTLIATEAAHQLVYEDIAARLGHPLPQSILQAIVGVDRGGTRDIVAAAMGPDFPLDQFFNESDVHFGAMVEAGIPLRPGVIALLDHLRATGVPMAVATSTAKAYAAHRLEKVGLLDYFQTVVTRDDVIHAKPNPEPYLVAAARLGLDPADCIAIEDSHAGVRSSTSAGVPTIMVPDLLPPTGELADLCAEVLPSLDDLRELLLNRE